jgi:FMN-dependent NADH-azoreductase
MSLFRLDASIRAEGSHSREIADIVEQEWRTAHPADTVVTRHIGIEPVPATAWPTAANAAGIPEADLTPAQRDAIAMATAEVDALIGANALLFAVPLYNYGVSQHFKSWVDLTLTDVRVNPSRGGQALRGKPAILVTVRSGGYGPGTPREGWDHATGWMRRILADVWGLDLRVVEAELTLADVTPAMAELRGMAAELRTRAEEAARQEGRQLAGLVTA